MATAFIGLGSNLVDREANLQGALAHLRRLPQTEVVKVSRWVETEPVGGLSQGMYLNGVAQLKTRLSPQELLKALQRVEQVLGRPKVHPRWGPRVIDLDLLSYDEKVLKTPRLTLPHPRMHEREFVLLPLAEVAPGWRHPKLHRSVRELLEPFAEASLNH